MRNITISDLEWEGTDNFTAGRSQQVNAIVIHWWGDPDAGYTVQGVINTFKNRASQTSSHFVVHKDRAIQMVNMDNTAWHSLQANPHTVGIEINPQTPGNTYETVGALVRFIREQYGRELPLHPHSRYVATQCPGTIDINKIEAIAQGNYQPEEPEKEEPVAQDELYRVFKNGKQVAAYAYKKNAWNGYKKHEADKVTFQGDDVTKELYAKYKKRDEEEPKDTDEDKPDEKLIEEKNEETRALVEENNSLLRWLVDFFKKLFNKN